MMRSQESLEELRATADNVTKQADGSRSNIETMLSIDQRMMLHEALREDTKSATTRRGGKSVKSKSDKTKTGLTPAMPKENCSLNTNECPSTKNPAPGARKTSREQTETLTEGKGEPEKRRPLTKKELAQVKANTDWSQFENPPDVEPERIWNPDPFNCGHKPKISNPGLRGTISQPRYEDGNSSEEDYVVV